MGQSFIKQRSKSFYRRIRVGRGLEIGDEVLTISVPPSQATSSLVNLLRDAPP
jgi:hypothetical protein